MIEINLMVCKEFNVPLDTLLNTDVDTYFGYLDTFLKKTIHNEY